MDIDHDYERVVRQQREANRRVLMQLDLKGSVEELMQECLRSRPPREVKPRQRTEKPLVEIRRSERSVGREAPVYVDSLPRRLLSESGASKGRRRTSDCSDDDDGRPRRKPMRNPVVSGRGWRDCLGVANQQAQDQAKNAAKACSERLAAAGRLVSQPKTLTDSQVSGGFWHNLPSAWFRRYAHEPKGYKWLHCNDKWPARPRGNDSDVSSSGGNGHMSLHSQHNSANGDDAIPARNDSESTPGSSMWRWPVVFMPRDKGGGGLSGGWRGFAIDHALYPGDAIVYEQIADPPSYGTHHWIVHVFRAYDYDTSVRPASAGSVPDEEPLFGCFDDSDQVELLGNLEAAEQARANGGRIQTVSRPAKASSQCQRSQQQQQQQQHPQQQSQSNQGVSSTGAAGCVSHRASQQLNKGSSNPPSANKDTSREPLAGSTGKKDGTNSNSSRMVNRDGSNGNSSRVLAGSNVDKQGSGAKGQEGCNNSSRVQAGGKASSVDKQGSRAKGQEGSKRQGQHQQHQQQQKKQQRQKQVQQQQHEASARAQGAAMEEEEEEEEEFFLKRIKGYMFAPPVGQSKPVDWFYIRWWGEYDRPQYDSWEPISCLDQEPWKYAWAKGALPKKWQAQRAAWLQSLSASGRAQFERDEAEEQALEEKEAKAMKRK